MCETKAESMKRKQRAWNERKEREAKEHEAKAKSVKRKQRA
jgi:hypothetical protein